MPRFKIYGADEATGQDVTATITADTLEDAEAVAGGRKIMVSRLVELEEAPAPTAPTPAPPQAAPDKPSRTETMVWEGHPSQWSNATTYIMAVLFSWLLFPLLLAMIAYLKTKATKYVVTNQRIKILSGLMGRDIEEVELYRVKDSSLSRSIFDKIRGTGSVILHTSDRTTPVVWIRCIPNAVPLREQIRTLVEERREAKGVREVDYA